MPMEGSWIDSSVPEDWKPPEIDFSVAHASRVYDYWLGGKDNFPADREVAEQVIAVRPTVIRDIRANRAFLARAVRFLADEAGIRQFLDIGTGIPAAGNTHEVAQSVAPESRIVYVDNDPIVLAHARSLLVGSHQGATAYLDADLRVPGTILEQARRLLDFSQPIAVMLIGIMHLISDSDDPYEIVSSLGDVTVPGSYLALTQPASDIDADIVAEGARRYNQQVVTPQTRRNYQETLRFFDGLDLAEPGLVQCQRWRPDPDAKDLADNVSCYGGVGRKS
jgi:hypothetical protein